VSLRARARTFPALYPAAILVAFVLNFMVETAVSPYAAGRPLIAALLVGLALPWLVGLATGDRDLAGIVGVVLVFLLVAAPAPAAAVLCVVALALVALQRQLARRRTVVRPGPDRLWPTVTRILTAGALILLVAVGVKAVQLGRVQTAVHDLVAEFPVRAPAAVATSTADLPNIYLVLLDGYPRADKLRSEFGIDASGFTRALDERGFVVATHSRSNYTSTRLTLAQMFNYSPRIDIATGTEGGPRPWRQYINEGRFFSDIRGLGYEVVAVSSGFENVALRQADRFIDTGQLNEFEWVLAQMTGVRVAADALYPTALADHHRARILNAFDVTVDVAREAPAGPRFVFTHVMAPHSPQVFAADGSAVNSPGFALFDDLEEVSALGLAEYARRLDGQIAFINAKVIDLVDRIVAADRDAVVVVFSDHGSGTSTYGDDPSGWDADLRTANLLAVRSPGRSGIIEDRSTLANVLPRLLRAYAGIGPPDVPETIYAWTELPGASFVFERPD